MARSFRAVLAALLVVFALPLAALITTATAAQATTACPTGMAPSNGFPCVATGFTTKLVGVTSPDDGGWGGAYGSVAFAANGDPIVIGPDSTGRSQRFDHTQTTGQYGTFPRTPGYEAHVGNLGCGGGSANDGNTIYVQTYQGIKTLDPATGAVTGNGTGPYGCWGVSVNPVTHDVYYETNGDQGACNGFDYRPYGYNGCYNSALGWIPFNDRQGVYKSSVVGGVLQPAVRFSDGGGSDQIAWDPSGQYLFVSINNGVQVFGIDGQYKYSFYFTAAGHGGGTDGIAFPGAGAKFVVTNNTDGTVSKFNFTGGDYSQPPVSEELIASGGSRGDNSGVGADGCLYVTQSQTFHDGVIDGTPSVVQICNPGGGFAPPAGLGASFTVAQNQPYSGPVGTFTNADPSVTLADLSATINWGDGTAPTPGTISGGTGGAFTVSGTHVYDHAFSPSVTVTVTATHGAPVPAITSTGKVTDAPLVAGAPIDLAITGGAPFTGTVGTFTDTDPTPNLADLSASINWGDGTPDSAGTIGADPAGGFRVTGSHDYTVEGVHQVTVSVLDVGGASATLSARATVTLRLAQVIQLAVSAPHYWGEALVSVGGTGGGSLNPVTFSGTTPDICTVAPDGTVALHAGHAGTCSFQADQAGNAQYNPATSATGTFEVLAPNRLTISGGTATAVYGSGDPAFHPVVTGLLGGDTLLTAPVCGVSGAHADVGSYDIVCKDAAASPKYDIAYGVGKLRVTPATVTITAQDKSQVYGHGDAAITFAATGLLGGDTLTGPPACAVPAHGTVGLYTITCASAVLGGNYTAVYVNGTLSVTPATITITADDKSVVYGSADPVFTSSVSGLVGGDIIDIPASCAPAPHHDVTAVGYPITCSGATASSNYVVVYAGATLKVTQATATITADNASKVYGDGDPAIGFQTAGLVYDDSLTALPTCAPVGAHVNAGNYTVACTDAAAGGNYKVVYLTGILSVTKATLTVTANDASRIYHQPNPTFTGTLAGVVLADVITPSFATALGNSTQAGEYVGAIKATVSGSRLSNYDVVAIDGTLTVNQMPTALVITSSGTQLGGSVTAKASLTEKLTGATIPGQTVTFTAGGASAAGTTNPASAALNVGLGQYQLTASFGGDRNYVASGSAAQTLSVYGLSSGGTFVIGDRNAAAGSAVTFWGSQWSSANALTGGPAQSSFKGFASSATTPANGSIWNTGPGNSANPPATVPAYVAVIVTSSVTKSGSTISGNTVHVVIVKTDAGYAGNPGHAGTGKVVATIS